MFRLVLLLSLLAISACKGPPPPLEEVQGAALPVIPLDGSLAALEETFDRFKDVPRVVVLLPPRCEVCASGLASVRINLLEAFPRRGLHVLVVLAGGECCDACGAAVLERLEDERVTVFEDRAGVAGRAFTRGLLPVAEACDVFLFYPRGARWSDEAVTPCEQPHANLPRAGDWWHSMGRIAPERHCTVAQLDTALQATMARLLLEGPAESIVRQ